MPELVRSVVSRFQVFLKDRRQSPRLRVRLLFDVAIQRAHGSGALKRRQTVQGHTRDISVNGLAMLVPQVHLEGHHLAASGRELQVQLDMGGGVSISMLVVPRRYERLEEAELGCNYLIGARIVSISEADQIRYLNFINERLANAA
ncbi:MAG TPA: PilZ domain-containing protein [Pyrinomonadaceae bacterium]|jgi:c-di-GMP-binding flagellar brake protein YcgR|nr:PilZ domain-containing protein [Pyrinomonadaceae bacterium]